ncbi:hypothetical protein REPUB_Repub17cG0013100 [Reevesia pubescens]
MEEIQRIKAENPEIPHLETFSAAAKNWARYFPNSPAASSVSGSSNNLKNSPSRKNGIDEATETTLRIYGCDLIQESGILLKLPQAVMATGQVIFHHFYCKKSFARFDVKLRIFIGISIQVGFNKGTTPVVALLSIDGIFNVWISLDYILEQLHGIHFAGGIVIHYLIDDMSKVYSRHSCVLSFRVGIHFHTIVFDVFTTTFRTLHQILVLISL